MQVTEKIKVGLIIEIVKDMLKQILYILLIYAPLTIITSCGEQIKKPENSCNFEQNSDKQRVSWKGQIPIQIYAELSVPTKYRNDIQRAMRKWNNEFGKELFIYVSEFGDAPPDNTVGVYWIHDWEDDKTSEQARTTIRWTDNKISNATVKINSQDFSYYSSGENAIGGQVDMESLMVHELGHVLGLGHINNEASVMNDILSPGQERRNLKEIDKNSLACEY